MSAGRISRLVTLGQAMTLYVYQRARRELYTCASRYSSLGILGDFQHNSTIIAGQATLVAVGYKYSKLAREPQKDWWEMARPKRYADVYFEMRCKKPLELSMIVF